MADDEQDAHAPEVRPVSPPTSGEQPFQIAHVQVERRHLGPLPPPKQLRAYAATARRAPGEPTTQQQTNKRSSINTYLNGVPAAGSCRSRTNRSIPIKRSRTRSA